MVESMIDFLAFDCFVECFGPRLRNENECLHFFWRGIACCQQFSVVDNLRANHVVRTEEEKSAGFGCWARFFHDLFWVFVRAFWTLAGEIVEFVKSPCSVFSHVTILFGVQSVSGRIEGIAT